MMTTATWQPTASLAALRARAAMLARVRAYFAATGVLEVETPACSVYATTDPTLESLRTQFVGPGYPQGLPLYLHTSPEFAMKRLLAAGCGAIYQICQVYRDGELGPVHSPEFSLLEWYRPGLDHHQLMDDVAALITTVAERFIPQQRYSYAELFQQYLNLDPHNTDITTLRSRALTLGIAGIEFIELPDQNAWLDLCMTHYIEPRLPKAELIFIYDYPITQAALARIRPATPPVAERFELYLGGMELANGFHELGDATEQEQRFRANLALRQARGLPNVPLDKNLLAALQAGLPSCSGVALGLDRLLMWLTGAKHIDQVLAFPLGRA